MKKINRLLVVPFVMLCASGVTSCGENSTSGVTLRILNSEDYIYLNDPQDPTSAADLIDQFCEYIKSDEELIAEHPEYKNVNVVYDTSDTNESMYSELMTGKSNYDLMCISDYMAQKIVSGGYAVPIIDADSDWPEIPNYEAYASKEIKGMLDEIVALKKEQDEEGKWVDVPYYLKDYAVGYMWGTLGILFNPYYKTGITPSLPDDGGILLDLDEEESPLEEEQIERLQKVITDMQTFSTLWNSDYKGTISIKNSMRDTYACGLLEAYKDDFTEIKEKYEADPISYPLEDYKRDFSTLFNQCDQTAVDRVYNALTALKGNIFGLEVDSGKQDIVTQKIGVNLAWSGDAVYSMDQAEDPVQVGEDMFSLCYAVPENGSNVWMDVWVMPNCPRTDAQSDLARRFLDFVCDPYNAAQNMNYTGYTSFIGGDDIVDLVRDWYDIRCDEIYFYDEEEDYYYSVYSINGSSEYELVDFPDCVSSSHDVLRDAHELKYFIPYEDEETGEYIEDPIEAGLDYDTFLENSEFIDISEAEDPINKTYGDLVLADEEYETVDLRYFFLGTTDEYSEEDLYFYSDCYLPFDNGEGEQNISVGRQFFCQYPDEQVINRCAVMADYGENNKLVMAMWEKFRSNPLPTQSIIIFVVIIAAALALVLYLLINRMIKTSLRNKRKAKQK